MTIKAKEIINNKVINKSGCYLGKVVDFDVDALTQAVVRYYVQGKFLGFFKKLLIIYPNQIISIKKDRIIVDDATVSKKIAKKKTESNIEYAK